MNPPVNPLEPRKDGKATILNIDVLFERLTLWHWPIVTFAFLRGIPYTVNLMLLVFIAPNIRFWCKENKDSITLSNQTLNSISWDECITDNGTQCTEFEFDRSVYYGKTIVEEWNLICNKHWLISTTQSIYLFGNMVGTIFFSHIADWFGRKRSIIISLMWSFISGIAIAFSPNIIWYNILRFFAAVGTSGYADGAFTMVVETSSPKQRYLPTLTAGIGWSIGMILFPLWAYLIQDWYMLHLIVPAPIIVLLIISWFLPESPRWQMSSGKYDDARATLMTLIKRQPRFTEKDVDFIIEHSQQRNSGGELKTKATIADLFSKKYRRSSCILCCLLLLGSMTWYHVTVSTATVGANPYIAFVIGASFELPAKVANVLFIRFVRRRRAITIAMALTGLALAAVAILPTEMVWLKLALLVFCKVWSQVQGSVSRVQMSEIYPTIVRSVAIGFMVTLGSGGQMIAPFLENLAQHTSQAVPFGILSAMCLLVIGLVYFLQETFEVELPDVIHKKVKKPRKTVYTMH